MEITVEPINDSAPTPIRLSDIELKDQSKASLWVARDLDKASIQTIEQLADGLKNVNPSTKLDKAKDQMTNGTYVLYYIEQDGKMIGYATIFPEENDQIKSCYLNKVFTKEDQTQKGVATKLIMQVMQDFDRVSLIDTIDEELPSKAGMDNLYERLGFKFDGEMAYEWTRTPQKEDINS